MLFAPLCQEWLEKSWCQLQAIETENNGSYGTGALSDAPPYLIISAVTEYDNTEHALEDRGEQHDSNQLCKGAKPPL